MWWTTSHGTINEIYNPTIDKPQVRDLELLVTDGESFVHEEKRDLKHSFAYIVGGAGGGDVNSDPAGRYTMTKQIISDPHAPVLLMQVKLAGDEELLRKLKVYALLAPHWTGAARTTTAGCWMWPGGGCCWRGGTGRRWRWRRIADSPARAADLWALAMASRM